MMRRRSRGRRLWLALVAFAVAAAFAGGAIAAFPDTNVETYTGCLNVGGTSGGTVNQVALGLSPLKACGSNQRVVHLGGGDITKVAAGSGLTASPTAGDNGAVTLSLDTAHSLPQNCDTFAFPMKGASDWVCGAHAIGTGLALTRTVSSGSGTTEYSLASSYRVKNTPDCDTGKFATGFDDTGTIQCATPAASVQTFQARQTNFADGDGVPDDGDYHTYVSLSVPAGTYLVSGKGVLFQGDDDLPTFYITPGIACRLGNLPDEYTAIGEGKDNEPDWYPFALSGVVTTSGEALTLQCSATDDLDLISVQNATLTALKVG
jgi:hypothetical protein